jgi:hypothetical protein
VDRTYSSGQPIVETGLTAGIGNVGAALPTHEMLEALAGHQGFVVPITLMREATLAHAARRQDVEVLRRVLLTYLDAIEPEAALAWIRNGGRADPT